MKKLLGILLVAALVSCDSNKNESRKTTMLNYPETRKVDQSDNYHGTRIVDPYRWLEYDTATDVEAWVKEQNKVTHHYLEQISFRDKVKERLTEIWNYPKYSAPFREGKNLFYFKNDGLQNQNVLFLQTDGKEEVFLDPNKFSADGTAALASLGVNKDHTLMAYGVAESGSDWNEIFVMDIASRKKLTDHIRWVKFSGAAWYKNGFFYCRYDEPVKGKEFSNQNSNQKVFYHQIGKDQKDDQLIYEDRKDSLRYYGPQVTEDEKYLFLTISEGTSGSEIWFKDLSKNEKDFRLLAKGFSNNYTIVDNEGERIFVLTDLNAPRYRLVEVDPAKPEPENWKDVIPQSSELLESVGTGGGKFFATYLKDASSRVYQFDYSGKKEREITLPGIGTAGGFGCERNEKDFYYSFTSFITPGEIHHYSIADGKSELFRKSDVKFNPSELEAKQVFFASKDGTKVPMFIIHKKGLKLDGNNPTLLYGYGGFNISLTPAFSISRIFFLEKGGVYAIANLRGGGEYGEDWHKGGMLANKQNVFDDFIAAAEYLIKEKYTSSEKLAINGGSNGGLLVGAAITQRPELFKAAIPAVGVLDMLRYHKFTIGWGWAVDYGSSDSAEQFKYLIKYSPLHNIKEGVNYPSTMIMTADHDDRVVPAHSFKFAAALQAAQKKDGNPVLIRIDTKAGHGAGKPTAKLIEDATDFWSFVMWELGMEM